MTLVYTIKRSPDFIFRCLSDMQTFVKVHPVIYKIESLGMNEYLIFEKLPFIPFPFTYKAVVESNTETKRVSIRAVVMKVVSIEMNVEIKEIEDCCLINETILFKSYLPIKFIMQQIFRKQHKQLFQNIEKA